MGSQTPVGKIPYQAVLPKAYHCKAKDAVARSYVASHQRFETEEQLHAYFDRLGLEKDDKTRLKILRPGSPGTATPGTKPAEVDRDEPPFRKPNMKETFASFVHSRIGFPKIKIKWNRENGVTDSQARIVIKDILQKGTWKFHDTCHMEAEMERFDRWVEETYSEDPSVQG